MHGECVIWDPLVLVALSTFDIRAQYRALVGYFGGAWAKSSKQRV